MENVIEQLENILENVPRQLNGLPKEVIDHKISPEKWSKKEILGHLTDSATNNLHRFVHGQYEDQPHLIYDQDAWVKLQAYQNLPVQLIVEWWMSTNRQIVNVLKNMPVEHCGRSCNTGKNDEALYDLQWLAKDYVDHLQHHLQQIFSGVSPLKP